MAAFEASDLWFDRTESSSLLLLRASQFAGARARDVNRRIASVVVPAIALVDVRVCGTHPGRAFHRGDRLPECVAVVRIRLAQIDTHVRRLFGFRRIRLNCFA